MLLPAISALLFISCVRRGAACLSVEVLIACEWITPFTGSSSPYLPPFLVIPVRL